MGARRVYWGCCMSAHWVYWGCSVSARWVYWGCSMDARWVYWGCGAVGMVGARWVRDGCTEAVVWVRDNACTGAVVWVRDGCAGAVIWVCDGAPGLQYGLEPVFPYPTDGALRETNSRGTQTQIAADLTSSEMGAQTAPRITARTPSLGAAEGGTLGPPVWAL
eukprot:1196212-Prorocentrum_minimum.AAC.4